LVIISTWLNITGIILELIGFGIILFAVRAVKPKGGSFSSVWDKNQNLMSTLYPKLNTLGIGLVIAGLLFQLGGSVT
jgi:hypothetical protein